MLCCAPHACSTAPPRSGVGFIFYFLFIYFFFFFSCIHVAILEYAGGGGGRRGILFLRTNVKRPWKTEKRGPGAAVLEKPTTGRETTAPRASDFFSPRLLLHVHKKERKRKKHDTNAVLSSSFCSVSSYAHETVPPGPCDEPWMKGCCKDTFGGSHDITQNSLAVAARRLPTRAQDSPEHSSDAPLELNANIYDSTQNSRRRRLHLRVAAAAPVLPLSPPLSPLPLLPSLSWTGMKRQKTAMEQRRLSFSLVHSLSRHLN